MAHRLSIQVVSRGFSSFVKTGSPRYNFRHVFCRSSRPLSHTGRPSILSRCYLSSGALGYSSDRYWMLHELVSQGKYSEAIAVWEEEKSSGQTLDPSMYTVVMSVCDKIGSGEAAIAVKEDIDRMGWKMDMECMQHYLNALLSDGMRDEAMEFVKTEHNDKVEFLAMAANCFHLRGYLEDASSICDFDSSNDSPQLVALKLEILGSMQRPSEMWTLIREMYGGNISTAPVAVQTAMIDGLALAGQCHEALDLLGKIKDRSNTGLPLTVKSVALLLESAKRTGNFKAGAVVCQDLWDSVSSVKFERSTAPKQDVHSYLLRAVNAGLHLQAQVLKQHKLSKQDVLKLKKFDEISATNTSLMEELRDRRSWYPEEVRPLMSQDFYRVLKDNSIVPDRHTYEALLFMSCYSDVAMAMADQVLRQSLKNCGVEYRPDSFTSWTQHCGPILPYQVARLLGLVKLHSHGYDIQFGLAEYKQLLQLEYDCGKNRRLEKEAVDVVRNIKNMMESRGMLKSHEGWNILFTALSRLGNIGPLITSFNDMQEKGIQPDLSTYHLIIDSVIATRNRKSITGLIFPLWRIIVQDYPRVQPNVELMNKLIRSCCVSQHYERAFFFLASMKDCNVTPNLETFRELLHTCHSEGDMDKFTLTVNMAEKTLPHQQADIDAIVAEYRNKWEASSDIALAKKIIMQNPSPLEQV